MLYAEDRSTAVPAPPVVGGFTNRLLTVVDCVGTPAEVPGMGATVAAGRPAAVSGAVALAVSVSVLVLLVLVGLSDAGTPMGKLDVGAERLTLLLKPLKGSIVIVMAGVPPWLIDTPVSGVGTSSNQGSSSVT